MGSEFRRTHASSVLDHHHYQMRAGRPRTMRVVIRVKTERGTVQVRLSTTLITLSLSSEKIQRRSLALNHIQAMPMCVAINGMTDEANRVAPDRGVLS